MDISMLLDIGMLSDVVQMWHVSFTFQTSWLQDWCVTQTPQHPIGNINIQQPTTRGAAPALINTDKYTHEKDATSA